MDSLVFGFYVWVPFRAARSPFCKPGTYIAPEPKAQLLLEWGRQQVINLHQPLLIWGCLLLQAGSLRRSGDRARGVSDRGGASGGRGRVRARTQKSGYQQLERWQLYSCGLLANGVLWPQVMGLLCVRVHMCIAKPQQMTTLDWQPPSE